jgi:hypothetical protein
VKISIALLKIKTMKIFYTLLMIICATDVIAQPVINADWVPSPGDTFVMQKANYDQLNFGLSGSGGYGLTGNNVSWDFSQLSLIDSYDTITYSGTIDTLIRKDMSGYNPMYWQGHNLMIGVSAYMSCYDNGQGSYNYFNGSNVFYHFPMNDSLVYTIVSPAYSYSGGNGQCGSQVQCLGWGKLLLPGGLQFDSALLLVQTFDTTCEIIDDNEDDYGYSFPLYGEILQTSSYQWIVPGTKNPILTINAWVRNNVYYHFDSTGEFTTGTADTLTTIYVYRASFLRDSVNILPPGIYPNPATDKFFISMLNEPASDYEVTLYDLSGRVVMRSSFTGQELMMRRGGIDAGSYLIQVMDRRTQNTFQKRIVFE